MRNAPTFDGAAMTLHHRRPSRYFGYTAMDWFKFYGFLALLLLWMAFTYTHYFSLFEDIESQSHDYQVFVAYFSGIPLLLVLPAVLGFFWWAAGALTRYSRWQLRQPMLWRWFWFGVLLFYACLGIDPLDSIQRTMSRKGLGLAPNLLALFDGRFETFQFQWAGFLLWTLFWFLVVAVHWSYVLNGLRVVWFYTLRFHRYGASLLTGFRETMAVAQLPPVTESWGGHAEPSSRGHSFPRLAVDGLSEAEAVAIIAADQSGAIVAAPHQPTVLFVDLGRFSFDPGLLELRRPDGTPLLSFEADWAKPMARREDLLVPLGRGPSADGGAQ